MLTKSAFFIVVAIVVGSLAIVAGSMGLVAFQMAVVDPARAQAKVTAPPASTTASGAQASQGTTTPSGTSGAAGTSTPGKTTGSAPAAGSSSAAKPDAATSASYVEQPATTATTSGGTTSSTATGGQAKATTAPAPDTKTSASQAPAATTATTPATGTSGQSKVAATTPAPDAKTSASQAPAAATSSQSKVATAPAPATDARTSASQAPGTPSVTGYRLRIEANDKWYSKPLSYLVASVSGAQISMREREWEGSITTDGVTMTVYYLNNGAVASRQVTGQNRARYEAKLTLSARLSDGRVSGTYSYEAQVANTLRGNDGVSYNVDRITLTSRGNVSGGVQNDGSYLLNFQGPAQEVWRSSTVSSQQRVTTLPSLGQFRAVIQ